MSDQFEDIARQLTPEIYQNMRRAVELGRWPDGRKVSDEQRQTCMQAIIAWERAHLPEDQRTGYIPPKEQPCSTDADAGQPVTLRGGHKHDA